MIMGCKNGLLANVKNSLVVIIPCLRENIELRYLEILLDREPAATCFVVTFTKLGQLILVRMVIFGVYVRRALLLCQIPLFAVVQNAEWIVP